MSDHHLSRREEYTTNSNSSTMFPHEKPGELWNAKAMKQFLKAGIGAQRVELLVSGEPEEEMAIVQLVSLFQCLEGFLTPTQTHVPARPLG